MLSKKISNDVIPYSMFWYVLWPVVPSCSKYQSYVYFSSSWRYQTFLIICLKRSLFTVKPVLFEASEKNGLIIPPTQKVHETLHFGNVCKKFYTFSMSKELDESSALMMICWLKILCLLIFIWSTNKYPSFCKILSHYSWSNINHYFEKLNI